ncbi:MAG: pilus assembly protein [Alphaproteobacteria bacterium]|nr:pilus assembly protein [Alphaproteobacteria bacterium]
MLLFPYMLLTLGILELAIMFTAQSLLEGATTSAARMVRTGELQQSGVGNEEQVFRDALCEYAAVFIDCENIVVEVKPLDSFFDDIAPQFDADGNIVSEGFNSGGSGDSMLIRTSYRYGMMTPVVGPLIMGPDSSTLFISTIVMQTEPYDFQGAGS